VSSTPSGHAIDENGFRKCKAEDTRPVISACPEVDRLASIQRSKGGHYIQARPSEEFSGAADQNLNRPVHRTAGSERRDVE
jgi:hypothetical protein